MILNKLTSYFFTRATVPHARTSVTANASTEARLVIEGKKTTEPVHPKKRLKVFRGLLRYFINPAHKLRHLAYAIFFGYAAVKTPGLWLGANNAARGLGKIPGTNEVDLRKIASRSYLFPFPEEVNASTTDIDNFVENYEGFPKVLDAAQISKIKDPKPLDENGNHILLDTSREIENLIRLFQDSLETLEDNEDKQKVEEAICLLNEISLVSEKLWGRDGPNLDNIYQHGKNCQIVADLIGLALTPENIQKLKGSVRVTEFDLKNQYPYINTLVVIGSDAIPVLHNKLAEWYGCDVLAVPYKGSEEGESSQIHDPILGTKVLAYAIEKKLQDKYTPIPHTLTSSSTTLITGENYSTIPLPFISDETLIEILKKAPDTIIKLGSYPTISDYTTRIAENTGIIEHGSNEDELKNCHIFPNHNYVVKGIRLTNDGYMIRVKASDPDNAKQVEFNLTLKEVRKHMLLLDTPNRLLNIIDGPTLLVYLFALLGLVSVRVAALIKERSLLGKLSAKKSVS